MQRQPGKWEKSIIDVTGYSYDCGHCGSKVGPSKSYYCTSGGSISARIFICPNCNNPTFVGHNFSTQVPGPIFGENIEYLPSDVEKLYNEARKCISVNAYTAAVLSCRKLLMNVAVSKGAESGKSFASYVTFLDENHWIPPNGKDWVEHIRKMGNIAAHEIPSISREDAIELLEFVGALLRFVYELPGKMSRYKS